MTGSWVQTNIWSSDMALYDSMVNVSDQSSNLMIEAKVIQLMENSRYDQAIALFNRSSSSETFGSTSTINSMISIRLNQHALDHAENLARLCIRWAMDSGRTWYLLGDIGMKRNQPRAAAEFYAHALSRMPGTAEIYLSQYDALRAIHDDAGADIAINNALSSLQIRFKNPPSTIVPGDWYSLGLCYSKMDRLPLALVAYQKAQEGGLDSTTLYNSLGVVLARMGQLNEAVDVFRLAVEKDPANPSAIVNLDTALQKLKVSSEAVPRPARTDAPVQVPAD